MTCNHVAGLTSCVVDHDTVSPGIFVYSVGLKYSGPIRELDSTSGRTPADTLMSTPLPSHTLSAVGYSYRCIAGVLG